MNRILQIMLSLLLCTTWLVAQGMSKGQMGKGEAGKTKVEGCLQGQSGNFTLTDSTGKVYQLQGDATKLSEHVGHEVSIAGTVSESSRTSTAASGSEPILEVENVKHVSKTCKAAGGTSK